MNRAANIFWSSLWGHKQLDWPSWFYWWLAGSIAWSQQTSLRSLNANYKPNQWQANNLRVKDILTCCQLYNPRILLLHTAQCRENHSHPISAERLSNTLKQLYHHINHFLHEAGMARRLTIWTRQTIICQRNSNSFCMIYEDEWFLSTRIWNFIVLYS